MTLPLDTLNHSLTTDPFATLQVQTRQHRLHHRCGAYTFEDGPALTRLVSVHRPARILELGTALGYTACCLAYGSPHTHVDTIEGDHDHVQRARSQIARYGLQNRITVHHGDFALILADLTSTYDMVFFDGFAPEFPILMRLRELLTDGGMFVCSNLQLNHGRDAQRIATVWAKPDQWRQHESIEGGRTIVLAKAGV